MSSRYGYRAQPVPHDVKKFLKDFNYYIQHGDKAGILSCYSGGAGVKNDNNWPGVTEKYYRLNEWPNQESVIRECQFSRRQDAFFLILYREMRFRHLWTKSELRDKKIDHLMVLDAFQNYIDLFNEFLDENNRSLTVGLPLQWLWDMVNTFVGQYHWFQTYKRERMSRKGGSKLKAGSRIDWNEIMKNKMVWSTQTVLHYMHALCQIARIKQKYKPQLEITTQIPLELQMLGYFSMIGLLRIHVITGDYVSALRTMETPSIATHRNRANAIASCHISTGYYTGFAYLMQRRFVDAFFQFKTMFNKHAPPQPDTKYEAYDAGFNAKRELLMASLRVFFVASKLTTMSISNKDVRDYYERELFYDEFMDGATGSENDEESLQNWETLFKEGSPKFVTPSIPDDEDVMGSEENPMAKQQLDCFKRMVNSRVVVNRLRRELKHYKTIPIDRLASRVNEDHKKMYSMLLKLKYKAKQIYLQQQNMPSSAKEICDLQSNFNVKKNVVYIKEQRVKRGSQYTGDLLRYIRETQRKIGQIASVPAKTS